MELQLKVFEKHPAWSSVLFVWKTLIAKGHIAYLAGGCVRDGLIGRTPKDFDIASDAEPSEVESYFQQTIDIGKSFGVMIVHHNGFNVEVATFRKDGLYKDGRRPEAVNYSEPREDALRRDFTVNGLFYDIKNKTVIDYVQGALDLKNKSIRAIGEAKQRFTEDKLRIMRAVRFAAELNFEIEPLTWRAICEMSPEIRTVSAERITDEFRKIILSDNNVKGFFLLKTSRLLQQIWPSLRFFDSSVFEKYFYEGLSHLQGAQKVELTLALIIMLEVQFEAEHVGMNWRVGVDRELESLMFFKFPREVMRALSFSLRALPSALNLNTESLVLLSDDHGLTLLELLRLHLLLRRIELKPFNEFMQRYMSLSDTSGRLQKCFINGDDLEKAKIPAGPIYSELLTRVYHEQLDGRVKNKKQALEFVKNFWSPTKPRQP